jgi:signal transduction histidine kinase
LGAFAANLLFGAPVWAAIAIGVGNTLEGILGVYLLRRTPRFDIRLETLRDTVAFIGLAAALSTTVSATVGVLALRAAHIIGTHQILPTWCAWWLGDALGSLLVAPFLLAWSRFHLPAFRPLRIFEGLALAAILVGLGGYVLFADSAVKHEPFRQVWVFFPLFLWGAIRFGTRGLTAALLGMAALAIEGTAAGSGPFIRDSLLESLFYLQAFVGTAAASALIGSAVLAEKREAVASRDKVLAVVSHDLKNPLNTVKLSAQLLRRSGHLTAQDMKNADVIDRSAAQMRTLISDLLDLTTLRAGRLSLRPESVNLAALLKDVESSFQALVADRSQTLRLEVSQDLLAIADRERILQVLSNLLSNAVKFTPVGGTIVLRGEEIGGNAICSVSDSGPGIPASQQRHLFEPYSTGDPSRGTGLGLSIVHAIVQAHHGQVWFDSIEGKGTTVRFALPLVPKEGQATPRGWRSRLALVLLKHRSTAALRG